MHITLLEKLKYAVKSCARETCGVVQTGLSGMAVVRFDAPSAFMHEIYTPVLCLVLQGAKQIAIGDCLQEYAAGVGLIVRIETPVASKVIRASRERPYLAVVLNLDVGLLQELDVQVAQIQPHNVRGGPVFVVKKTEDALIDCALRLLRLARQPHAEPILRPGIVREVHYLLLTGPLGPSLRLLAKPNSHVQRIARAIALLRTRFARRLSTEVLAATAGMSSSSFHKHFKAITSSSPLQFQKQLRLLEARRLMVSEGMSSRRAAFTVGYESASQFTRDYARRFGLPPRREVQACTRIA
jgi:AraC-like DNA-binding protein